MRHSWIQGALFVLATWGVITGVALAGLPEEYPLEPPDTSSPRATLQGFLLDTKQATEMFEATTKAYYAQPGLFPSAALQAQGTRVDSEFRRASRYLDLSEIPPALREEVRTQAVFLLKEIVEFPPEEIAELSDSLDYPPEGSPAAKSRPESDPA